MTYSYKRTLVIGATSGIGRALAERIVETSPDCSVIAVGRRKENLESLVHKYGSEKVAAVPFDITKLEQIPNFTTNVISTFSDLDCVVLNSGIQRPFDFAKPESVDLDELELEFRTNYLAQVALAKAFIPHLQQKRGNKALIFMTSGLALVPILRCPNYCATKAALHQFILCLREQLKESGIKVIEIFPPAVQTELHDEKHQPDIKDGRSFGMPLDEFTNEEFDGLTKGLEQIPVGNSKKAFEGFEQGRQEAFHNMVKMMSAKK